MNLKISMNELCKFQYLLLIKEKNYKRKEFLIIYIFLVILVCILKYMKSSEFREADNGSNEI